MYLFDGYSSINHDDSNLEWIVKKYRVDNDTSIHYSLSGLGRNVEDTKVEWFLKWYTVDNDNTIDIKLTWILKKYRESRMITTLTWKGP